MRELSRMTPRLLTWGEKGTGNPSMMMGVAGVCYLRVALEPLSFRKFLLIQLQMSYRQVMEVGQMAVVVWRRCKPECHQHSSETGSHDGLESRLTSRLEVPYLHEMLAVSEV